MNEKVFVNGDLDVGIESYDGVIIEETKDNHFLIKDNDGNIDEIHRNQFKTLKDLEEEEKEYSLMKLPNKKYKIIYADPPWDFGGGGVYQDNNRPIRETKKEYPLMKLKDICDLPINKISAEDCILFIWTTDQHLPSCLEVIKSWGFKYSTVAFYWIKKTNKGNNCYNVGCWTMKSVEQCLLAIKGKPLKFKIKRNIKQLVEAERTKHSKKPNEVRNRIVELCGNLPRIELFAREKAKGWDVWGNEAPTETQNLLK